jgi:carbon storage regulator
MLVLSRKLGETIVINGSIEVTVVEIDRGKIRLGIKAPRDVPVYRSELLPLKDQTPTPAINNPGPNDGQAEPARQGAK